MMRIRDPNKTIRKIFEANPSLIDASYGWLLNKAVHF